jgi:succinoglycan biosynthesis protein ExoM
MNRVSVRERSGAETPAALSGRSKPPPLTISIVIPTQRRPLGLARAARSGLSQTGVDHAALELVIADNDQVPSARPMAERLAAEARFPVIYVHEPRSGVANARNAALGAASSAFIAFLDDDQEAPAGWLAALVDTQVRFGADVVFGPVQARVPVDVVEHRAYFEHFFSHLGPEEEGLKVGHTACGNSLVRRAALPDAHRPFSELRNQTGGEDDLLYGGMRTAGARFAWSPAARIFEDPLPERLSLRYTIPRAFAYGHGPTVHSAASTPPDRLGVARWMAIGALQALAFGLAAAGKWLVRAKDRALALDRAARGLGKALWWEPFNIQFYGHAPSSESSGPDGLGGGKRNARPPS